MKWNKSIVIIILLALTACENDFFKFNYSKGNDLNRTSSKDQLLSNKGVAFYLIKDFDLQKDFNFDSIVLEQEPFISYDQIVAYDSAAHVFQLNIDAYAFFLGEGNLDMKGFVLMVNSDTLYCGVLWSPIHSQVYNNVVLTLYIDNVVNANLIELVGGYPNEEFASTHVNFNDARLIEQLSSDNKLKLLVNSSETNPEVDPFPYVGGIDTMYYDHEIFNEAFVKIYGKWKLVSVSGGITGYGHEPNFDYLLICKYGIYSFIKTDSLLEAGKIAIDIQNSKSLQILFQPNESGPIFFYDREKKAEFSGSDELNLISPCCDRFNYHFKRIN